MVDVSARDPRIFISYRREDTAPYAGWLHDRLCQQYGGRNVFKDIDSLQPGSDFTRVIWQAVAGCNVVVAMMGPMWAGPQPPGQWRIWQPEDWVRIELEAAFSHGIRVIPLMLAGVPPLPAGFLPPSLEPLRNRHLLRFHYETFIDDVRKLVAAIENDTQTTFDVGPGGRSVSTRADRFADVERLFEAKVEITSGLSKFDKRFKAVNRRIEIDKLVDALDDDERPADLAIATVDDDPILPLADNIWSGGLAAVAPRRFIFVAKKPKDPYYLPYARILRSEKVGSARVVFTLADRNVDVMFSRNGKAADFAAYVSERLSR